MEKNRNQYIRGTGKAEQFRDKKKKEKAKWKQWRYNVYTGQMLLKMEEDHKEDLWIE